MTRAIINNIPSIRQISFLLSYILNNTSNPNPALVISPAVNAPKLTTPSINSCDKITLAAQLGMNPTSDANKGCKKLPAPKNCANASSPNS